MKRQYNIVYKLHNIALKYIILSKVPENIGGMGFSAICHLLYIRATAYSVTKLTCVLNCVLPVCAPKTLV